MLAPDAITIRSAKKSALPSILPATVIRLAAARRLPPDAPFHVDRFRGQTCIAADDAIRCNPH